MQYQYSLTHGNIPPHKNAVKVESSSLRYDGVTDGIHTGQKWIYNNEFYKPLDAKPFPNAEGRFDTQEANALFELGGIHPLFLNNWRAEWMNGRRWLIRPICELLCPKEYIQMTGESGALDIEKAIRAMNNAGWKLNDTITLAYDPKGKVFILDMSSAQRIDWKPDWNDEERNYVKRFWEYGKANHLVALRNNAHHLLTFSAWSIAHPKHKWVYASFNRPVSKSWATLPETSELITPQENPSWQRSIPHTWIITEQELDSKIVYSLELELGHFPWFYNPKFCY
jgi:hypothetical protein